MEKRGFIAFLVVFVVVPFLVLRRIRSGELTVTVRVRFSHEPQGNRRTPMTAISKMNTAQATNLLVRLGADKASLAGLDLPTLRVMATALAVGKGIDPNNVPPAERPKSDPVIDETGQPVVKTKTVETKTTEVKPAQGATEETPRMSRRERFLRGLKGER